MGTKELIEKLSAPYGVSGSENNISACVKEILKPFCKWVETDSFGNVTGFIPGKSRKKLMIDAHIDEIGLIITDVKERGFLLFETIGGTDVKILPGSEVTVFGKREVKGVIGAKPPHLKSDEDKDTLCVEDMSIDTGLSDAGEVIRVGDVAVYNAEFKNLLGDFVTARNLDDRAGVAVLCKIAESMKEPFFDTYICASVQEEVGLRGAKCLAQKIEPDYSICVDVTFGKADGSEEDSAECGKGPVIAICPGLDRKFYKKLIEIAQKEKISIQYETEGHSTGTNADAVMMSASCCSCAVVSVPIKYMHTTCEVANVKDVDSAASLINAFAEGVMIDA